jgi:hypothetical protein
MKQRATSRRICHAPSRESNHRRHALVSAVENNVSSPRSVRRVQKVAKLPREAASFRWLPRSGPMRANGGYCRAAEAARVRGRIGKAKRNIISHKIDGELHEIKSFIARCGSSLFLVASHAPYLFLPPTRRAGWRRRGNRPAIKVFPWSLASLFLKSTFPLCAKSKPSSMHFSAV